MLLAGYKSKDNHGFTLNIATAVRGGSNIVQNIQHKLGLAPVVEKSVANVKYMTRMIFLFPKVASGFLCVGM